ncbi:MAG: glycosyltransferase [Patescibacteria group bacterium]|jgi:glycosyltransferase involved in cell wall biosynthesis
MTEEQKQNLPLISVVIPTYNSGRTIEQCLKCVKNQTYPNLEIIVVDALKYDLDAMKKCRQIIARYAVYLQDGPERSIQRNRGINEAKGEYILILDQDMYLQPGVVEECYQTLSAGRFVALNIPEISIGEGFWTQCVALERFVSVYLEAGLNECARFFRRADAVKIGGYDPLIVGAEDSDWHYRLKRLGEIGKIKNFAYHDEGRIKFWSRVKKKYYYSAAFREYLRRRPGIATRQFFPLKPAYFKHPLVLLRQPLVMMGMFLLRSAEVAAGTLGLIFKKPNV